MQAPRPCDARGNEFAIPELLHPVGHLVGHDVGVDVDFHAAMLYDKC